ncbi:MAG: GNAT family N-acetyltransferase [Anaerolineae bacterium]|nr:GNAT family N-acetyltransferase [Anaerolineae bacterium]
MPANSFDIQIAHSIEEVGQAAWDDLAGGHPFAHYRWYRYAEAVLADDLPIYIILAHSGRPVARATFWLKRQEAIELSSKLARRLVEMILRRWPLLVCRTPLVDMPGLILPDPPLREAARQVITQVAQEQARRYRASFLVFDYLEREETERPGWANILIPTTLPDPGTHLDITWPDFESYLQHLSKKTRRQYRLNCNRAADLGIEIKRHAPPAPDETTLEQAVSLIHAVETYHGSPPTPWTQPMLSHAGMVEATWLTAELEGRLVGCATFFQDGATGLMTMLGRDYEVQYAYFQLIYEAICCTIEAGVRVLRGGSGAYEMKERLGFQVESNNYLAYATHHRGLQWLACRLTPE